MKEDVLNKLSELYDEIDAILDSSSEKLQVPELVLMIGNNRGMDEKESKELDHPIRYYLKNHDKWYLGRGAKGGILPLQVLKEKNKAKEEKESYKKEVLKKIEEKINERQSI